MDYYNIILLILLMRHKIKNRHSQRDLTFRMLFQGKNVDLEENFIALSGLKDLD